MTQAIRSERATQVVHRACTLCEATCGLDVFVEDGEVVRIQGDDLDPFSRGHVCPKAHGLLELQKDPDRLRQPMRRTETGWVPISWDEALELAASELGRIREAHGVDAIALYRGNPTVHDMASLVYWNVLQQAVPSANRYSAGSVDTWPRYVQVGSMFGGMLHIAVPDVDRTDYLLVLGANPLVSNGSLMTAPDMRGRLAALRARGGRLVVVDPRRSETAARADEHVFIRPGGDAAFLLGMLHTLFAEERVDLGRLAAFTNGLEEVRARVASFSPERAAATCGVPAETIRRLAREFSDAPRAACYGRMGTTVQSFGTLASWAIELMNVATGNLDREGGVQFTRPAASLEFAIAPGPDGLRFGRHQSRVGGHDEIFGELPVAALAEEMETPGPGQVRALVVIAGNPVTSVPNAERLDRALGGLEFMLAIDFYLNETTRHAHLILPPPPPLANPAYDLALNHLAVRNVAKLSPAAVAPEPGTLPVWEILLGLAGRLMGLGALPPTQLDDLVLRRLTERALSASAFAGQVSVDEVVAKLSAGGGEPGPLRILDMLLRLGHYGDGFGVHEQGLSLASFDAHPHGLDLGPLVPMLPGKLATASGRIELAPERIVADLPRLEAWMAEREAETGPERLWLIGRRDVRSMNSWLHNLPSLAKGKPRCTLQIHPADARRMGLAAGDDAWVSGRVGRVRAPVEITDALMPGVVSLPHGWGHDAEGARLGVAARRPGVNANRVVDDRLQDAPSGASVLNGIPVQVARAS
jgi:anaerobic selenocysteine-containing dehydrogenase